MRPARWTGAAESVCVVVLCERAASAAERVVGVRPEGVRGRGLEGGRGSVVLVGFILGRGMEGGYGRCNLEYVGWMVSLWVVWCRLFGVSVSFDGWYCVDCVSAECRHDRVR